MSFALLCLPSFFLFSLLFTLFFFFFFLPLRNSLYPVTQLCPTLRDPMGLQPTRLLHPWDFPGNSSEVGCHCLLRKTGLKCNIKKTEVTASGPITSWQIEGKKVETVTDFLFLGSKITADGDYSHEIRRNLFLGRKAMTNLDHILKSKDINLPTKVCIIKAVFFQ